MNDIFFSTLLYLGYYLVVVAPTILVKFYLNIPLEIARKWQHIGHSLSIFLLLELFSSWYWAVAAALTLAIIAYPVLWLFEGGKLYTRALTDRSRRGGELKRQLLYAQLTFSLLIFLFWGLLGADWRYLVGVAVMGWGFGDAAAALVGKTFGRNAFSHPAADKSKTHEGTTAMIIAAGLALFFTLLLYAGQSWTVSLLIAIILAPICGAVELFSRRGTDTLTVPLTTALLLLPLVTVFTHLGW